MHFESGYESFKKLGGAFEKQEKGSNTKKKNIILQEQLNEVKESNKEVGGGGVEI